MPTLKNANLVSISLACIMFLTLAGALNASSIGVAAGSTCEAGSCPAAPLPFNSTDTLPIDFTTTLADGDIYLIDGSFTDFNNGDGGGFSTGHDFQITYEGNAAGGPSSADSITVQAYYAFQTTFGSVTFGRDVIGAFGPTIAASSSASSCVNLTLGCVGPVTPPGSFGPVTSFGLSSAGGVFVFDPAFTNNFGAGSAVGSYIVWGQDTPIAAPAPEPASLALLASGLIGIFLAWKRASGRPTKPGIANSCSMQ